MPASQYQNDDIVWECLHKHSAYVKKFNGITLTKEPMNASRVHCKKHCGLLSKSVGIAINDRSIKRERGKKGIVNDRSIVLMVKNGKSRNPIKNVESIRLCADQKTSMPRIVKAIGKSRPDMLKRVERSLAIAGKINHYVVPMADK